MSPTKTPASRPRLPPRWTHHSNEASESSVMSTPNRVGPPPHPTISPMTGVSEASTEPTKLETGPNHRRRKRKRPNGSRIRATAKPSWNARISLTKGVKIATMSGKRGGCRRSRTPRPRRASASPIECAPSAGKYKSTLAKTTRNETTTGRMQAAASRPSSSRTWRTGSW